MDRDNNYIGTHLVMDITTYESEPLKDEGKVSNYLSELIRLADMTCLVHPQVFKFPYDNEYKKFLEKLREEGTTSPLIEERLGILDYNETAVKVNTTIGIITIEGDGLYLESITDEGISIKGTIIRVEFE